MELQTDTLTELDLLAEKIAAPLSAQLKQLEGKADLLVYELSQAKTALAEEKQKRAKDVEWYIHKASLLQEERDILQEQIAEILPRPKEHQHDPDEAQPVMTFDFDGTIKPQIAKGDGGNYPLTDKYSNPYPEIQGWMDRWKSRGACIHLATAGLYYDGPQGLEVYRARLEMLQGWVYRYGLPVDIILPKIPADCYYDDRMIEIPGDPSMRDDAGPAPDWDSIGEFAENELSKRFAINEYGIWERKPKNRVGKEIENWPDEKLFKDQPRGYSGAEVDVDLHRTLSLASSSLRVASPRPDGVESVRKMYTDGITIYISCAGWNPRTHSLVDSIRRLAGIRQWLKQWSVPYDRVVTKDHADMYFDDKGIRFSGDWKTDLPRIYGKLPAIISYVKF